MKNQGELRIHYFNMRNQASYYEMPCMNGNETSHRTIEFQETHHEERELRFGRKMVLK